VAATRSHAIGAVTIFADAQAAVWRMTLVDPRLGQKYALEARRHIAALRAKEPNVVKVEIRWCPSRSGQMPRAEPGSSSPGPGTASTAPARSRSQTPRWRRPTSASPRGSTS